jgi:hypothetical protein
MRVRMSAATKFSPSPCASGRGRDSGKGCTSDALGYTHLSPNALTQAESETVLHRDARSQTLPKEDRSRPSQQP